MKALKRTILIFFMINCLLPILAQNKFRSMEESLKSTTIFPIDTEINDEIISANITIEADNNNYFSYKIESKQEFRIFTIKNPEKKSFKIDCIFSETTELDNIKDKFTTSICELAATEKSEIAIVLFNVTGYSEDTPLYLIFNIQSSSSNEMTVYFRKDGVDYWSEYKDFYYPYAFKYSWNEISFMIETVKKTNNYYYYFNKPDFFQLYGYKDGKFEYIETTSLIIFSNQAIASYFYNYTYIYAFIGTKDYNPEKEKIVAWTTPHIHIGMDYAYYNLNSSTIQDNQIQYYKKCTKKIDNYLYVNYEDLKDEDLWLVVEKLEGTDLEFTNSISTEKNKFPSFDGYKKISSNLYVLPKNESHIHGFRLNCSGADQVIDVKLKYVNHTYLSTTNIVAKAGQIPGVFYGFTKSNALKVSYNNIDEMKIEIYTGDTPSIFTLSFEGKTYSVNSTQQIYLYRTSQTYNQLSISSSQEQKAYVFVSSSIKIQEEGLPIQIAEGIYMQAVYQKYNANYSMEISIEKNYQENYPICYYISEIASIQTTTKQCIFYGMNYEYSLSFPYFFKRVPDEEYDETSIFKPKKYYVFLFRPDFKEVTYYSWRVNTDLPKATSINFKFNSDLMYNTDSFFKKDNDTYFGVEFGYLGQVLSNEGAFALYVLNDTSKYDDFKIDMKCIVEYELGLPDYIDKFTEENNVCKVINSKDKNPNLYHFVYDRRNYFKYHEVSLLMKIRVNYDVHLRLFLRNAGKGSGVFYDLNIFDSDEYIGISNPLEYHLYYLNKTYLSQIGTKDLAIYTSEPDGILIYAKESDDSYTLIEKDDFIFIKYQEFCYKYPNYENFIVMFGRNDPFYKDEFSMHVNFELNRKIYFYKTPSFPGNFNIPLYVDNCDQFTYKYIVFNYGKQYNDSDIYLSSKVYNGKITQAYYINDLRHTYYEYFPELKSMQKIESSPQHYNLIVFSCKDNTMLYLTYFEVKDYSNEKKELKEGNIESVAIKPGKNQTFTYINIPEIKIELLSEEEIPLKILFEKQAKKIRNGKVILNRTDDDINEFSIANLGSEDAQLLLIKISTNVKIETLPKTEIEDLYKYENKYVYESPKFASKNEFTISRVNTFSEQNKRNLAENDEIKVCYYPDTMVYLETTSVNCFFMKDTYTLVYEPPHNLSSTQYYIMIYPEDSTQEIKINNVETEIDEDRVEEEIEEEEEDQKEEEREEEKDDRDDKRDDDKGKGNKTNNEGSGAGTVLLVIFIVILIIGLIGAIIFFVIKRKSRVTSNDIDTIILGEQKEQPLTSQ